MITGDHGVILSAAVRLPLEFSRRTRSTVYARLAAGMITYLGHLGIGAPASGANNGDNSLRVPRILARRCQLAWPTLRNAQFTQTVERQLPWLGSRARATASLRRTTVTGHAIQPSARSDHRERRLLGSAMSWPRLTAPRRPRRTGQRAMPPPGRLIRTQSARPAAGSRRAQSRATQDHLRS
jgi:hypothetical protein